jgi:hypothetical protein
MIDADLDRRLRRWLETDAGTIRAPARLRERISAIPVTPAHPGTGWLRFSWWRAPAALALAVAGIFVAVTFFDALDRPPGADGGTCNNRQLQHALDALRDSAGYRFVRHQQYQQFDPAAEVSVENPKYIWSDGAISEGGYLAPDRARERVTFVDKALTDPGYQEHLQIGGHAYRLSTVDGVPEWVRESQNWPTANFAYGYIQGAVSQFPLPGVSTLRFGEVAVPDGLPGERGCTAAMVVPAPEIPGPAVVSGPPATVVAVRVALSSEQTTAIYIGPAADAAPVRGAYRTTFEITAGTPDADEFQVPAQFVEEDSTFGTPPPATPTPTAAPVDPSAWVPVELPNPALEGGGAGVAAVATGNDRFVAVGGLSPPGVDAKSGWAGVVWTSTDGRDWTLVDRPAGFAELYFTTVKWDGSSFMALGYRMHQTSAHGTAAPDRPESWTSTDGITWEQGGQLEAGANNGPLVAGGPGWVTTGSVWTGTVQRPAVFTSRDGSTWSTSRVEGTAFGSVSRLIVLDDGSLLAYGCETPEATNSGQVNNACLTRPWRSDDGVTWTTGAIMDLDLWDLARTPDGLLAIVNQPDGELALYRSQDGEAWRPAPKLSAGPNRTPESIRVIGNGLVVLGSIGTTDGFPSAMAWRSTDGTTWEPISLGLPEGALGSSVVGVVEGSEGLALAGGVQLNETRAVPVVWLEP